MISTSNKLEQLLKERGLIADGKINYKGIKTATGIPERTLRSWLSGEREPAPWVIGLLEYYFKTGGFR